VLANDDAARSAIASAVGRASWGACARGAEERSLFFLAALFWLTACVLVRCLCVLLFKRACGVNMRVRVCVQAGARARRFKKPRRG